MGNSTPNLDFELYTGTTFGDLCKEVHLRSKQKKEQLEVLISQISTQIKQPNDIQVFMPRIKELLEVGVKNDEQLVKLCAVVQRHQATQEAAVDGVGLSDAEKEQLLQTAMRDVATLTGIAQEINTLTPPP
jgi:phage gp29-like protein